MDRRLHVSLLICYCLVYVSCCLSSFNSFVYTMVDVSIFVVWSFCCITQVTYNFSHKKATPHDVYANYDIQTFPPSIYIITRDRRPHCHCLSQSHQPFCEDCCSSPMTCTCRMKYKTPLLHGKSKYFLSKHSVHYIHMQQLS